MGRLEYVRSTPLLAEWQPWLPELIKRLEETLYTKFPNKVLLSVSPSLFQFSDFFVIKHFLGSKSKQ
jgi:hypothetical protein